MQPPDLPHPDDGHSDSRGSDSHGDDRCEKVVILPLGDESKKITQTLSSDSARHVLESLAEKPMSASELACELEIPLTTVKYNLDALIESGLATVKQTRWSVKGRKIKIYAPMQKLIVVVPGKTDRKSAIEILKRYLGVVLGAAGISTVIEWWHQPMPMGTGGAGGMDMMEETAGVVGMVGTGDRAATVTEGAEKAGGSCIPELEYVPAPTELAEEEVFAGERATDAFSGAEGGVEEIAEAVEGMEGVQSGEWADGVVRDVIEETVAECAPSATSTAPAASATPAPSGTLPVPEPASVASPIPKGLGVDAGAGVDLASIDLSQMLGAHPGAWFFFGCIFVVVFLALMEYRRRGS